MESETEKDTGMGEDVEGSSSWHLLITRVANGYVLTVSEGWEEVIEDSEEDELKSGEQLLWFVMDYFNFCGSKHDLERVRVVRQKNK